MRNIAVAVMVAFALLFLYGCIFQNSQSNTISASSQISNIISNISGINNTDSDKTEEYEFANQACLDVNVPGIPLLSSCGSNSDYLNKLGIYFDGYKEDYKVSTMTVCYLCVALDWKDPGVCDELDAAAMKECHELYNYTATVPEYNCPITKRISNHGYTVNVTKKC